MEAPDRIGVPAAVNGVVHMKCVEIREKKLVLADRPVPKPKSGEVLVKVHAAGVNHADLLQRKGLYPPPAGASDIPGLEISGEIAELGGSVRGLRRGQKVCAILTGGGYAEYCVVPAVQCLPLPREMDFVTAAGIPETFFTVWANLFDLGQLEKGDTLLVHGGASGIGTTAIQLARAFGIRIFVTAGTDAKCKFCKGLGASLAVNYKTQDFVPEVLRVTKGRGVDMVLDMVGGDYLPRNLRVLRTGGWHVSIAAMHGRLAEVDILNIMINRLILTGSTLRSRSIDEKGMIAARLLKDVWPLLHRRGFFFSLFSPKRITPIIDNTFPLAEAQAAHDYMEVGSHVGKIILKVIE